jgi:2'-5' RNA ligase
MSPFPEYLIDRWRDGRDDVASEHGVAYWHILLGTDSRVRAMVASAQGKLVKFSGLHMTPLQWLHITVLIAGQASTFTDDDLNHMLNLASLSLSRSSPIVVEMKRIFYHPEAIVLPVDSPAALDPIREAAEFATREITGTDGVAVRSSWLPHVTLCYSTRTQPAGPVIATLGEELPGCNIRIDKLSLVIQHGRERLWHWSLVGTAALAGLANSGAVFNAFEVTS